MDVYIGTRQNDFELAYFKIGDIELWDETVKATETHLTIYEGDLVSG